MYLNEDRDDVAFLTGSGSSESRLNSKRDLYERGHVAVCSHGQAICITVFVFSSIVATSFIVAFARPWNDCVNFEIPTTVENKPDIPIATNGEVFPWNDVRLPIFVRPLSYDLELTPNLTTLAVKGIIKLIFQVTEETDFIIFHSKNISITSKTINEKLRVQRMLEYPERDQIYLETHQPMKPGRTYSIRLKFAYNLTEALEGFYLSTYKDKSGQYRNLATTHFEPTSARRGFPCFDEPQLKAKFLVTITHDRNLKSFFNMPIKEQTPVRGKDDQIRTEFEESQLMSTYLVAFVICDFELIKSNTKSNITIRVIAAKDKIDQAKFALDQATKITENYEKFFGIPYPLPKQDLIAIPDFGAGAMENWGLITYRETSLLYTEGHSSTKSQQWVATVIAHELAHQWFGNLVTMKWWNDLWLNEGFASWMEYKGVAETMPEWGMQDQFWANVMQHALIADALQTSHPISVPVNDPKDIEAIFDVISYKKGSSIIRMLERYLGGDDLRKGLEIYLKKHKFKNAVTKDLWEALSQATNNTKDVEAMMNTWTLQMGYPLITFTQLHNSSAFNITQSRFLVSSQVEGVNVSLPISRYNYTWVLPFDYKTNNNKSAVVLLKSGKNTGGRVNVEPGTKWIKANTDGYGFYRVNYTAQIWSALIDQLQTNHSVFSQADRAQLIDDAFELCKAGIISHDVPLSLISYLKKETELVPWTVAIRHLRSWLSIFSEGDGRVLVDHLVRDLIQTIYTRLGWEDKGSHVDRLLRTTIIATAIKVGLPHAVNMSTSTFQAVREGQTEISSELQETVYCSGISTGDKSHWDWAYSKYNTTNIPSERGVVLKALACSRDVFVLQEYLDITLQKSKVRSQDVRTVITEIAANPSGSFLAWRHLRRHWDKYYQLFHRGSFTMGAIIKGVTARFSTSFDLHQVEDFFANRNVGAGDLALKQSIETIKVNVKFRESVEKSIINWINAHYAQVN